MRLWVSEDRTVLVTEYEHGDGCEVGRMEVAVREDPDAVWGPPVVVLPERLR